MSNYLTIGRIREDGDLDVAATLNNDWIYLPKNEFLHCAKTLAKNLLGKDFVIVERQDAPDAIEFIENERNVIFRG